MKAYKGFNKDMTCRGFKFVEGETYETKEKIKICETGFHACESPLDILDYYSLESSIYREVELLGEIQKYKTGDSKVCSNKIKIGKEISFKDIITETINYATNASSGDYAKNASSGYYAKNASSGDYATQIVEGKFSVAVDAGRDGRVKGIKGTWICLTEWVFSDKEKTYIPLVCKSAKIDGKKLKENVFYTLKNKKFVEC